MFFAVATLLLAATCYGQEPVPQRHISTDDLQSSVRIIGPLGLEIGKLVEVEAIAETGSGKMATPWLSIEKVDGKIPPKPIRMEYSVYNWANIERLEDGVRVKLNVFQEFGTRGLPAGVMEQTVSVATRGYGLHTWLVVVNQTSPIKPKNRNTYYDSLNGGHPLEKRMQKE